MMSRSKTQFAILGALSIESMSGYKIKKMMSESTNHFWSESNGQIYPTLAKLTNSSFVTVKECLEDGKSKKIYTITKAGKKALTDWLLKDVEHYPARNELLLKLFYGQNVSKLVSISHIEKYKGRCSQALSLYQDIEKNLFKLVKSGKRPVYFLLTAKSGINIIEAQLEWCEESIQLINKYGK